MSEKVAVIKPHYAAAYLGSGRKVSSEAELMLKVRQVELSGDTLNIFEVLQEHVNNAYEYYEGFSHTDMLKLELMSMIMREVADAAEEEGER